MVHGGRVEGNIIFMAAVALSAGRNVIGGFAQRRGAIVAGGACACCGRGVGISNRCPGRGRMVATVTLSSGGYMSGWLGLGILRDV